jgi:hypothetical protein
MADAGASLVKPVKAGDLKKGSHVVIKGFPCKVIEVTTSKVSRGTGDLRAAPGSGPSWASPCRTPAQGAC